MCDMFTDKLALMKGNTYTHIKEVMKRSQSGGGGGREGLDCK